MQRSSDRPLRCSTSSSVSFDSGVMINHTMGLLTLYYQSTNDRILALRILLNYVLLCEGIVGNVGDCA